MKTITIELEPPFDFGGIGMTFVGLNPPGTRMVTYCMDLQETTHIKVNAEGEVQEQEP